MLDNRPDGGRIGCVYNDRPATHAFFCAYIESITLATERVLSFMSFVRLLHVVAGPFLPFISFSLKI